ncbi:MAG: hypothetical protein K8U57_14380 [Planctomycetes bacterium]|nr:hypothetical protein [Planctomycetota bacterium]
MLRRRPMLVACSILVLIISGVVGIIGTMLKCEPAFYTAAACPADYDTREKASRVLTRIQDLKTDIRTKGEWGETFTAEELNCFFAEMMTANGNFASLLPEGFHSPRVAVEGDRLKLGLRYGEGFWGAVVWIELRTWLVADEINLMAVEVCDLRAGRLAVGTQTVLDAIAEAARSSNIDVTWYRHNGNPVGLFRFFPDQPQAASNILTLETREGKVVVAGRTRTDLPIPTKLAP